MNVDCSTVRSVAADLLTSFHALFFFRCHYYRFPSEALPIFQALPVFFFEVCSGSLTCLCTSFFLISMFSLLFLFIFAQQVVAVVSTSFFFSSRTPLHWTLWPASVVVERWFLHIYVHIYTNH